MNNNKIKVSDSEDPSLGLGMTLIFYSGGGKEATIRVRTTLMSQINNCESSLFPL